MSSGVITLSQSLLEVFPLEHFRPIFFTGTYGSEVYYHLNPEDIDAYAEVFRKSSDWVSKEHQEPTYFFQNKTSIL